MFSRGGADSKAEAWGLGERAQLLLHLDSAALIPHVLASQGRKLPIEVSTRDALLSNIPPSSAQKDPIPYTLT